MCLQNPNFTWTSVSRRSENREAHVSGQVKGTQYDHRHWLLLSYEGAKSIKCEVPGLSAPWTRRNRTRKVTLPRTPPLTIRHLPFPRQTDTSPETRVQRGH